MATDSTMTVKSETPGPPAQPQLEAMVPTMSAMVLVIAPDGSGVELMGPNILKSVFPKGTTLVSRRVKEIYYATLSIPQSSGVVLSQILALHAGAARELSQLIPWISLEAATNLLKNMPACTLRSLEAIKIQTHTLLLLCRGICVHRSHNKASACAAMETSVASVVSSLFLLCFFCAYTRLNGFV